jgi:methyltransferase
VSVPLYLTLLALVAAGRFLELRRSARNQAILAQNGGSKTPEPHYRWMVALHAGILIGAALEVLLLRRTFVPWLAALAGGVFIAANLARWWVIHTLGPRWNVQVMSASRLGVVTAAGPYKWVRHPNYTAVFAEMLALPLIHSAYIAAVVGAVLHVFVLRNRVRLEESVLMQDPGWRAAFARRPRFFPGIV